MKKLAVVLVLCCGFMIAGCTPTETTKQRNRRYAQITNIQMKMLVEDWDYFWLYDHSTQTSQWHVWSGI